MGPPGSGKSTLGNELDNRGFATYTELEPLIVEMFGQGEAFVPKRPQAHRWIRNFYRQQLVEANLPVVIETTGIGDREFLQELAQRYSLLLVMLTTPRDLCLDRIGTRPKGRNVNAPGKPMQQFYDDWHSQTKPTYEFDLSVSGTDLERAVATIHAALES
jgi:predicted kinase